MCPVTYGYAVDKNQQTKRINSETVLSNNQTHYTWFHLNSGHEKAKKWLRTKGKLPIHITDHLLSSDSRPTILDFPEGTLVSLRGVNTLPDGVLEDFNSINIWLEKNRIISIRNHRILSIEDVLHRFEDNTPPQNVAAFLALLINKMNRHIGNVITKIEDERDIIEESICQENNEIKRDDITNLRKRIVQLRRYIVPQRDVLQKLCYETYKCVDEKSALELRTSYDRLLHFIEDIDLIKDHLILSQEEISNKINEDMNKTMFRLSMVSIIFLPLSFITSLFGINIAGMPGVNYQYAFPIFSATCFLFLVAVYTYLKLKQKL